LGADGLTGQIEAVDPLVASWIARCGDTYPLQVED
jgi:hypothetical protein